MVTTCVCIHGISCRLESSMTAKVVACGFVSFFVSLRFNVQVNNFSVMLGRSHCFLGIYQPEYRGELKVSCSRTLHDVRGVRTPDL